MASKRCGAMFGDKHASTCILPEGHEGAHASELPPPQCEHRDENGHATLYYFHDGSRCTQCGAFV